MEYAILKELEMIEKKCFVHQITSLNNVLLMKNWHKTISILDDLIPVCIDQRYSVFKSLIAKQINLQIYQEFKHAKRVSFYAKQLAQALSCSLCDIHIIEQGGFVHDFGKLLIEPQLLYKKDPLSDIEWKIIQKHPQFGCELLSLSKHFHHLIPVVEQHHEWWNGNGYPNGLKGDEILLPSRILSVVDAYDAMTCNRTYQKRIGSDAAAEEIKQFAGSQFDLSLIHI